MHTNSGRSSHMNALKRRAAVERDQKREMRGHVEWATVSRSNGVHVVPLYGRSHELHADCWCGPSLEQFDEPRLTHFSDN